MPQQKTITVYRFSELSDKDKDYAMNKHAEYFGYSLADDALISLRKLAEHFGGSLTDYDIDFFACSHSSASFDMPEQDFTEGDDLPSIRLKEQIDALGSYNPKTLKGNGDCVLTGYCADEDAIDGLRQSYHSGERNLTKLMQCAFKTWLRACQSDCEAQYSYDDFSEMCDANDYLFYENGRLYM